MAFDSLKHAVGAENIGTAKAGSDLSGLQYRAVLLTGTGVLPAISVQSGLVGVLYNTPASGEAVQMYCTPHTVKARAGAAITVGAHVTITGSSFFTAATSGDPYRVGNAYTAAASGDVFTLRLT